MRRQNAELYKALYSRFENGLCAAFALTGYRSKSKNKPQGPGMLMRPIPFQAC